MPQWIVENKGKIGFSVAVLAIILSVVYIGMPTYKKVVEERETLKTRVSTLEQEKQEIKTEYENYKRNYSEDTVKIVEPIILPNGSLAIDGQGKAVYRTSITHKRNVVIEDEKSRETILSLTAKLTDTQAELDKLKKQVVVKREIRRVVGVAGSPDLKNVGLWVDAQIIGPLWTGADLIFEDYKAGFNLSNTTVYLRAGLGF